MKLYFLLLCSLFISSALLAMNAEVSLVKRLKMEVDGFDRSVVGQMTDNEKGMVKECEEICQFGCGAVCFPVVEAGCDSCGPGVGMLGFATGRYVFGPFYGHLTGLALVKHFRHQFPKEKSE